MKRLIAVVIVLCLAGIATAQVGSSDNEVTSIKAPGITMGNIGIKMNMQSIASYPVGDEGTEENSDFYLKRLRFILYGDVVPDRVGFVFQGEALANPFLLDLKLILKNYIPYTSITFGRFLPNYTYYMPQSTAALDFVEYPLTTARYACWRQVGIETRTKLSGFDLTLGALNGGDRDSGRHTDSWHDNDNAKDFLTRLDYTLQLQGQSNVTFGAYGWFGSDTEVYNTGAVDINGAPIMDDVDGLAWTRYGAFTHLHMNGLRATAEMINGTTEHLTDPTTGDAVTSVDGFAYFGQAMYRVGDIEGLVRYGSNDPNTDVDDDAEQRLTFGCNYYFPAQGSMVFLNYMIRTEEGTSIDNDLILLQFQISF